MTRTILPSHELPPGAPPNDLTPYTFREFAVDQSAQAMDFYMAGPSHDSRMRSFSLSLPWRRPKHSMFTTSTYELPHHFSDLAIDDEAVDSYEGPRPRGLSHGHTPQHGTGIRQIIRRASVSLRGIVHRRPSTVVGEAIPKDQTATSSRPTTAHSAWSRFRHPTGIRQSRSFYGLDYTQEPAPIVQRPIHTSYLARPGIGNEPPIIPESSGAAAKASAAASNEFLMQQNLQARWLQPSSSEDGNDVESGIGINVTAPEDNTSQIICVDFVSKLPLELAIHVLASLNCLSLCQASCVSKNWKQIIQNPHIWRESCLRETTNTYATGKRIPPDAGLGVPKILPSTDWREIYRIRKVLSDRWKTGIARPVFLNGHTDSIYCLQFDEHKIVTGSRDRTIRIWDIHTLKCQLVIGPPEIVNRKELLVNPEGLPAHYSANTENNERLVSSTPRPVSFAEHHNASILCLQFDDEILATGSSDGSCIIYDIRSGYRPIMRLRRHTAAVLDLAFDDKHIVTCSKDISICVWDRATGNLIHQLRGHKGPVNAVQMRGNTIVSCSGDCVVKLWNIDTGKNIREFVGHTKGLACSQFSEDGRFVASAGNDKAIRIWDANTGECVREMTAHKNLVRSLHIDSVSGRLVSGSYDTDIKVWDMESGYQLLDFPRWHSSWVLSAKSDYRRIISTGQDPKILIMDFGAEIEGIDMLESGGRYDGAGGFI